MFDLNNIKNIVIASIATFFIGWGVGYYTKTQFFKADKLDTVVEAQIETAQNIATSIDRSQSVEEQVRASDQKVATIRKTVVKRSQPKENISAPQNDQPSPACTIDAGTVSLLNAARDRATPVGADGSVNAESQAPAEVGVPELIDNDLEVVKLYHELAIRHDDLVDQVRDFLNKQQGK